jgi:hypothetical protein
MAKKRKTKKYSRRRKMSGVGATGNVTNIISMVAGAVIGKVIATKFADKVNSKILAGGQIAAGVLLPRFVKNKFVSGIGQGMIINGAVSGLQSFGVISAINGVVGADEIAYEYMSGTDELSTIAGDDMYIDEGTMSGTDELSTIAALDMEEGLEDY